MLLIRRPGQFDSATGVPFANRQDHRDNLWGFFVQDDYKIRPNLTINAGLRWSYFGAFTSKENNLDVLQFGSGANPLTGLNVRVGGGLYIAAEEQLGTADRLRLAADEPERESGRPRRIRDQLQPE